MTCMINCQENLCYFVGQIIFLHHQRLWLIYSSSSIHNPHKTYNKISLGKNTLSCAYHLASSFTCLHFFCTITKLWTFYNLSCHFVFSSTDDDDGGGDDWANILQAMWCGHMFDLHHQLTQQKNKPHCTVCILYIGW